MSIETEAHKDLALTDGDADNVVGGKKTRKKTVKHPAAAAGSRPPLLIKQDIVYYPVVDQTLPPSDCDPGDGSSVVADSAI